MAPRSGVRPLHVGPTAAEPAAAANHHSSLSGATLALTGDRAADRASQETVDTASGDRPPSARASCIFCRDRPCNVKDHFPSSAAPLCILGPYVALDVSLSTSPSRQPSPCPGARAPEGPPRSTGGGGDDNANSTLETELKNYRSSILPWLAAKQRAEPLLNPTEPEWFGGRSGAAAGDAEPGRGRPSAATHAAIRASVAAAFESAAGMLQEPAARNPGPSVGESPPNGGGATAHGGADRSGSLRGDVRQRGRLVAPQGPPPRRSGPPYETQAEAQAALIMESRIESQALDFLDGARAEDDDERLFEGKCTACADAYAAYMWEDFALTAECLCEYRPLPLP